MSTKNLRAVLKYLKDTNQETPVSAAAEAEVEAIEKAVTGAADIMEDVAEELDLAVGKNNAGSTNGTLTQNAALLRSETSRLRAIARESGQ